jgi:uncharacterized protein YdeI (YjbR/CyaY-like superfamily)
MKFTSAKEITANAATIKTYVREAIAIAKAGLRVEPKKTSTIQSRRSLSIGSEATRVSSAPSKR